MYLVTGGAGFIGSNLVRSLCGRGEAVRVLDNLSTGTLANLEEVRDRIEFVEGDICDLETCRKALVGVRFVLHQAALPSVPRSIKDPIGSSAVNIQGTLNLLVAAAEQAGRVERFVFASSSSIYGDTPTLPKEETMMPSPQSPYAVTKLAGEHFCRVFSRVYQLPTIALRYFNVYGPRQNAQSTYAAVIPRFIMHALQGTPAMIYGDGKQSRDFTFVDDCVNANLLACASTAPGVEVCNVAAGHRISIQELHDLIQKIVGRQVPSRFEAAREGDVRDSLADISKARELLGYTPHHDLMTGLTRTVEWFRKAS